MGGMHDQASAAGARSFDDLLAAAQAGEAFGFDGLVRLLHSRLLAFVRARRAVDPDGLANEVLARMCETIETFAGNETQFRAWVFTIARHRLIDEHRRSLRQVKIEHVPTEELAGNIAAAETVDAVDQQERVEYLLAALTDDQREVVLLRVLGGLTVDETALVVGRRPGAVRALQHRALRQLRRQLDADLVEAMAG